MVRQHLIAEKLHSRTAMVPKKTEPHTQRHYADSATLVVTLRNNYVTMCVSSSPVKNTSGGAQKFSSVYRRVVCVFVCEYQLVP